MRRALVAAPNGAFDYPDARGVEPARIALATYLNRARATVARSDRVTFTSGSAQGIGLVCRVLRERGVRAVAVEDPGHADQCTDIRASGLTTPRIPVDAGGLRVDRLARTGAGAVLVTPAHQYPSGAVLAPERRAALLDWAERTGGIIIEDDYDAEYRYDREPIGALQGLAPDRVVYVGSASKVLSPALRLGWLLVPPELAADVERAKLQADRGSSAFEQLAFADFLSRGELDRHLRRTRPVYRRRRDALVAALHRQVKDLPIHGVAAGLHFMIELNADLDEPAVVAAAARRSVRVYGARAYRANPRLGPPALVVGYGGLDESEMAEGVRQLALAIAECRLESRERKSAAPDDA
jgi:GntR family transcriptional regulator / MocR family aminotransferase